MLSVVNIMEMQTDQVLRSCVDLLRAAFGTVAREFNITEETAPTNAAFATLENLQLHRQKGMVLYGMLCDSSVIGCVAIKRSKTNERTFYIERLAVAPDHRHRGYGGQLLSFALQRIVENGGTLASIGLIDNNHILKKWYLAKGFVQHECRRIAHLPFKVCYMNRELTDLCRHGLPASTEYHT